ncbi:zinc finger and SCAN domain-containing protein 29-like [Camponotus floridanus]|uniref:zinc finger and SCAN domain-containing protein 29-like n=1 Tax=Camponotus floridanus TaxID=104421 RepID=UPI000DC6932F|nr:zinc finger and SCAN domain-containing protein 29-like [Camponotus floridanus]
MREKAHDNECHVEVKITGSSKQQASWKDENAVKALISQWKLHEDKFKSTTITNDKVWNMIAAKLIEENPLWEYTGKQCENKFKDVRKMYTKTRDNNVNKSGQDLQTCKFYEEMDAVFGEKPIIKPVAIASNLKKHKRSPCAFLSSEDEEERENIENFTENKTNKKTEKPKKKSKVSKELEKWALLQQEAATVREQAKERRHEERMRHQAEAIKMYESVMNKLLHKF